jgi:hypothetical protein
LGFAAVFRILPGLGKIRVCIFQHRILVAMPKLFLQSDVPRFLVILSFGSALGGVLIVRVIWHDETSYDNEAATENPERSGPAPGAYFITRYRRDNSPKMASVQESMITDPLPHQTSASMRQGVRDAWLVLFMAVAASSLRIALWAADAITLWHLYGRATVARDHLRIVNVKPLVVSNGDVLRGIGPYHYFVGVVIWLPLTFALMSLIGYTLLPRRHRKALQAREQTQGGTAVSVIWALALPILITAVLPMWAALSVGAVSVVAASIWARRI